MARSHVISVAGRLGWGGARARRDASRHARSWPRRRPKSY